MIRVVSANAASGRLPDGTVDHGAWVADAARLDADVWAVQEVDRLLPRSGGADQTADLLAALGAGWEGRFGAAVHGTPGLPEGVVAAAAGDPVQASYGVALLTRLPVRAWHELHLEPSTARLPVPTEPGKVLWVPDEPRVALAAVTDEVTVVSTHLSFAPTRAVKQLREVVRWGSRLGGPLVVLGDLNLPRPVANLASGLEAAVAGATYPSASPKVQLDHVLVGRGLRLGDVDTHRLGGSDHLAVSATVHDGTHLGVS